MKACKTEGCEGELSERSKLDTCANCRANVRGWLKRRPAEVLYRRQRLTLFTTRIDEVIDERGLKGRKK
jgi:hypothetical protein